MRPQSQSGEGRTAELCLLQMAIEATEQLPKYWDKLKTRPVDYCVADPEQAAILDLYLLVWMWGHLRSQKSHRQVSGVRLRSRLRQLPFDEYPAISVLVHFDRELPRAA